MSLATYDGSGEVTHPDGLRIRKGDLSRFWMIATPYPGSYEKLENPSIGRSPVGLNRVEPALAIHWDLDRHPLRFSPHDSPLRFPTRTADPSGEVTPPHHFRFPRVHPVSIFSPPAATLRVEPKEGCGSLESPWTGWESQFEELVSSARPRVLLLAPGFYGLDRTVRLPDGIVLRGDGNGEGRPWFLPTVDPNRRLTALFEIDGAHDVTLTGVCLNGRDGRADHGIVVRCGTGLHFEHCRLGDFRSGGEGALVIDGESEDRPVRGVVIKGCHFLHNGVGMRLGPDTSDLLVAHNRFEETEGPVIRIDPGDRWSDYELIFVRNRIQASAPRRRGPLVDVRPGAEGIRFAENTFEGPGASPEGEPWAGIEVRGGGPLSGRRLEVLLNRMADLPGPGISARSCGIGFVAAGNRLTACGTATLAVMNLDGCSGALVEDNEINEPAGVGVRVTGGRGVRLNGNEVRGQLDRVMPRAGTCGILVAGEESRQVRLTDNRVTGIRETGIHVDGPTGVRLVGNEVEDCGVGIRVTRARNLLLVGNDCRDNGEGGVRVESGVRRGLVSLNFAIGNGVSDLEILGERIRCHSNKVDREGGLPVSVPRDG